MAKEKVVLAYSGGLDTSVIIPWLIENYDVEVIAMAADVGQAEELDGLNEKALKTGASKLYIEDLREEFVRDFIWPTLKAGAVYEGKYLLGTSMARPCIAKRLVEIAEKEGATIIAHGCTGKGNDQVRFELTIKALNPHMKIIAPWRIWDLKSRQDEIAYAEARGIPLPVTKEKPYSMDRNLWHLSHEGGQLEDPSLPPPTDLNQISSTPFEAPDEQETIELTFEQGIPVALNGEKMGGVALIDALNKLGAKYGVGIDDLVENRLVGMKSRGVYETPGGTIIYKALAQLESLTLDRITLHHKQQMALRYADLVYDGQWYTPLREAMDAYFDVVQKNTTGVSQLTLYKGACYNAGAKSEFSLYNPEFATFDEDSVYDQKDSAGFINLFGLPMTVRAIMNEKNAK